MVRYRRDRPPTRFVRLMHGAVGGAVFACLGLATGDIGGPYLLHWVALAGGLGFGLTYAYGDKVIEWIAELAYWIP